MTGHTRRQHRTYHARSQQQSHRHQQPRNLTHSTNSSIHPQQRSSYPQDRQRPTGCSLVICYSYLIAIFSSFLVVLGIYLSLTKFNARFLYLSLAGLSIEALGACLYCINNIHKSKLAQYKQTTDDFNLESNEVSSPNAAIPVSQRPSMSRQQQQARNLTHILMNRTLNQSAIPPDDSISRDNGRRPPANLTSPTDVQSTSGNPQPSSSSNDHQPFGNRRSDDLQHEASADNQTLYQDALSHSFELEATTNDNEQLPRSDQPTCQDSTDNSNALATSQSRKLSEQTQHDPNQNDNDAPGSHDNSAQLGKEISGQPATDSESRPYAIDQVDLTSQQTVAPPATEEQHQAIDAPQAIARGSLSPTSSQASESSNSHGRNRNSRHSNVRRTLVMGLSGEEEVIEIDEEDLDNMSILPPSYESIATADGASER